MSKLKVQLQESEKKVGALKVQNRELRNNLHEAKTQNGILKDQLTICRQDLKTLGCRSRPVETEDAKALEDAVTNMIKRRRKSDVEEDKPITLDEQRALGKDQIMSFAGQLKFSLPSWSSVLAACIDGKSSKPIESLAYLENFVDGFMIRVNP